jgi:DNA topoisomerase-3
MSADIFEKALEKLWIHGGAVIDFADNVSCGQSNWQTSYVAHSRLLKSTAEMCSGVIF